MESLTTLISENIAVKQVPISVVSSKSIGYIHLHGNKGLSFAVLRSIISSWMSHTVDPLSRIRPFRGISSSEVFMNIKNNNLGDLAPIVSSILNLRNVSVQCVTECQTSEQLRTILEEVRVVSLTTLKIRPSTPEISKHPSRPYWIGLGSYQEEVFDTLRKSTFEGLETSESCDVFLPSDNYPYWSAYMAEGDSVCFTVPENFNFEGMILCAMYLSTLEKTTTECLTSVLMVNYTKCTIQLFRGDTIISFNDVDWQGLISHLVCGDKVGIFVIFADGFVVQKTAVYLMRDRSIDKEMEMGVTSLNHILERLNY
ncbi:uncharacterized protein [Phaseolus vulgaris]|uniref:uncharacterized protein n=1 Tax=Phaseolus vulgaris TaxID=3885 RepID=UPI0035CC3E62